MRRLIINADDFGMTAGINRGIVEGCRQSTITSATLMANSGPFGDAVKRDQDKRAANAEARARARVRLHFSALPDNDAKISR